MTKFTMRRSGKPSSRPTTAAARCRACLSRFCSTRRISSRTGREARPAYGIPLSTIHHVAFDANLIGIDPDYRLHVSERLLGQNDGPMLEALKRLNGGAIHLPGRIKNHTARDRLALRFERFKAEA